jgi:hypothetical protein
MRPEPRWHLQHGASPGLRVYDFHPALIYLNAPDLRPYHELKREGALPNVSEERTAALVRKGLGAGSLFLLIADYLATRASRTLRDVADAYRRSAVT